MADGAKASQRDRLRDVATETADILAIGLYEAADGRLVDLSSDLRLSMVGTTRYIAPPLHDRAGGAMRITIADEDTITGIDTVLGAGGHLPAVLNFASATSPGGGFLRGSNAQEEALCRATTLFAALERQAGFYDRNADWPDAIYSNAILYTPSVRVIRDGHGWLRADPPRVAVLTAPAPNRRALQDHGHWPARRSALEAALDHRIRTSLAVAAERHHRHLVLGAWGCGVFGNDPADVARRFAAALDAMDPAPFDHVHFAIPSFGDDTNLNAFRAVFGDRVSG